MAGDLAADREEGAAGAAAGATATEVEAAGTTTARTTAAGAAAGGPTAGGLTTALAIALVRADGAITGVGHGVKRVEVLILAGERELSEFESLSAEAAVSRSWTIS